MIFKNLFASMFLSVASALPLTHTKSNLSLSNFDADFRFASESNPNGSIFEKSRSTNQVSNSFRFTDISYLEEALNVVFFFDIPTYTSQFQQDKMNYFYENLKDITVILYDYENSSTIFSLTYSSYQLWRYYYTLPQITRQSSDWRLNIRLNFYFESVATEYMSAKNDFGVYFNPTMLYETLDFIYLSGDGGDYQSGYDFGYDIGYDNGVKDGFDNGYDKGVKDTEISNNALGSIVYSVIGSVSGFILTLSQFEVFGVSIGSILAFVVGISLVLILIKVIT